MEEENKEIQIPDYLLNQIGEFSPEGFVLFSISEDGEPEMAYSFNNSISILALQSYIFQWAKSSHQINEDMMLTSMLQEDGEEFEDEDSNDQESPFEDEE